ncbi:hypothetical protein [Serratia ureilytica]|uniref:Uncharacterized protein n=1 Tax=Serratia ureilytica TaxID=300181 RepID=A0A9X9C2B0_9GAMM|nr:hypothetical protein [Serratia ureilytica]TXE26903.1 hypothetical protein FOT63_18375 [Serratia ureilytica]
MSAMYPEMLNALLQRYYFAANNGFTHEASARRTLLIGLESAVSFAYSCEDIKLAKAFQENFEALNNEGVIPAPI